MKTTLSVRDFALLYELAMQRMGSIEYEAERSIWTRINKNPTEYNIDGKAVYKEPEKYEIIAEASLNPMYTELKRLCDALGELQVEVQTPDVEIKDKQ